MLLWAVVSTALVPKVRVPARASSPAMQWYEGSAYRRPFISGNWALNPQTIEGEDLSLLAANRRAQGRAAMCPRRPPATPPFRCCHFPAVLLLQTALDHVEGTTLAGARTWSAQKGRSPHWRGVRGHGALVELLDGLLGHADRRLREDDQMIARGCLALDNDLRVCLRRRAGGGVRCGSARRDHGPAVEGAPAATTEVDAAKS